MNNYEIEMMRYYIRNYSGVAANKELAPMDVILQYWEHNKGNYLRKMFGEELILSKEITYTKPSEEIYDDMACLKENNEFYKNYIDFVNTFWFENRNLYWNMAELMNTDALVNNTYSWGNFTIGKIDVRAGCKVIRILGKIAKEFNLEGFEEFRLEHSRILNEKLFKGEVGSTITLEDENNVLDDYDIMESENHDIVKEDNKLIIHLNEEVRPLEKISLKRRHYDDAPLLVYSKGNSQKLSALRITYDKDSYFSLLNEEVPEIVEVPNTGSYNFALGIGTLLVGVGLVLAKIY